VRLTYRRVAVAGVIALLGPSASAVASPVAPAVVHHKTARLCSTVTTPGHVTCFAIQQTDTVQPADLSENAVSPNATPSGYGPSALAAAYKLDQTKGSGRTVAIVDAYNNPNAESDLAIYRAQYSLPPCTTGNGCFRKVNQSGSATNLPPDNAGWAVEISLDLDMVSATCPNCHILLVEANGASIADLGTAVSTAAHTAGVVAISNSYGTPAGSDAADSDFGSYYNQPGIAVTASTGDGGYVGGSYPASSSHVTAVGGTSLRTAANTRGWTETVWSGGGSGCSTYNAALAATSSINTGCATRAMADVSAVADPQTGVAGFSSGWHVYGGTSAAAPIIASVYALAGTPGASDQPNAYPYSHTSSLYDVTSGTNGACSTILCSAGTGWDGPTGLGTPNGTAAFGQPQAKSDYTRLAGADRYSTAVAISQYAFQTQPPGAQFAVTVASGINFPDALAAGPVAAAQDGPLLLVPQDGTLPAAVSNELATLTPRLVNIAGGAAAVSSPVETQLKSFGTGTVYRWAGQDRYETAAQLAEITNGLGNTVFIATGASFPDALGGSAAAGRLGGALMLTDRFALPNATASALTSGRPTEVVILGGEAVIDAAVIAQVKAIVPGATVQRWSGADRYATAAAISSSTYPQGATTAYLASGAGYPDALAGAPVAARAGAPLLLTSRDCVPASTLAELTRLGATKIVVLGGTSAVSDAAANLTPCPG
jgi:putative cell wall-binding protein